MEQYVKFDPKEMEIVGYDRLNYFLPPLPVYKSPITRRENFLRLYRREHPLWMPHTDDINYFFPTCVPDSVARGMITDTKVFTPDMLGGKDMFGIEWEYIPQVQGSMVRPGAPFVKDLDHWEDDMKFPDINTWDWEGCAERTEELRSDGRVVKISFYTGFFERLISMIDMTDALLAMIDEDYEEPIKRLFDRLADLYCAIFEKYGKYFHPDIVWFHDDWGNQLAPFFHAETLSEVIGPYMKRVVNAAHENGFFFDLHSCGKIESLVPAMIEMGIDSWQGQGMNDKLQVAKDHPEIIVDVDCPTLPAEASEEELRALLTPFANDFASRRAYVGLNFGHHPLENQLIYELTRKSYNP